MQDGMDRRHATESSEGDEGGEWGEMCLCQATQTNTAKYEAGGMEE
jgi:hypothetical protein